MLGAVLLCRHGWADIYTWTDKNGVIHFTNAPRGRQYRLAYRTGSGGLVGTATQRLIDRVPARDTSPSRYRRYDEHIREAATLYQLPEALIRAVIKVESDYDPRVVSSAGAEGLMQLMPATAQAMRVPDSFDPRSNILGGSRYLRVLANRFGGDLVLTVAGYHAGERAVERYRSIPPYETTQRYVRMVLKQYYRLRQSVSLLRGGGQGAGQVSSSASGQGPRP